jgi:uncharacterized protein (TIGR00290 family)
MKRILLSWSGGKDSAWALHVLRRSPQYKIMGLLTTVNQKFDRVAMHAVRRELLEAQAEAVGLPLIQVPLPWPCSNADYECAMRAAIEKARGAGVTAIAFGDLFLEDIRAYREQQLKDTGLEPIFPIWGLPTRELAHEMVASGLRARLTCVDPKQLDRRFVGQDFSAEFLAVLPHGVDPCGERGEFHTFVHRGPMLKAPIAVETGVIEERDGFVFADLLPGFRARSDGAGPASRQRSMRTR